MNVLRAAKILLVGAIALFATIVTFGNLTDYNTNFLFVQHVLSMDTIYPFSSTRYRAITDPALHRLVYAAIIAVEAAVAGNDGDAVNAIGSHARPLPVCEPTLL